MEAVGAWVPVSQVGAAMVAACRKWEEDEASEALDHLLRICKTQRVRASLPPSFVCSFRSHCHRPQISWLN